MRSGERVMGIWDWEVGSIRAENAIGVGSIGGLRRCRCLCILEVLPPLGFHFTVCVFFFFLSS